MKKYQDVGNKIGGSLKDIRKSQKIDINNIPSMTLTEKEFTISKNNLWPSPDYLDLLQNGASFGVVSLLKMLRDRLPLRPRLGRNLSDEKIHMGYDAYAIILNNIDKNINKIKNVTDLYSVINETYALLGITTSDPNNKIKLNHDQMIQISSILSNNNQIPFYFTDKDFETAQLQLKKIITKKEIALQKKEWRIATFNYGGDIGKRYGLVNYDNKLKKDVYYGINGRLKDFFKPEEVFLTQDELLKNKERLIKSTKQIKTKEPNNIRDSHLLRIGPSYRNDNITPIQLQKTFGLAGIEFGEQLSQKEKQKLINQTYDALADISNILNIPFNSIGLENSLFLAFASRGQNGNKAHYEPDKKVINLTRLRGAGTLAHEYGHALDHYIFRKTNGDVYIEKKNKKYSVMSSDQPELLLDNEKKVWNNLMNSILFTISNNKIIGDSNYVNEAKKTSKYAYYGNRQELFARAFECFVADSLLQKNQVNDFLVNNVDELAYKRIGLSFNLYPESYERKQIMHNIKTMISTCLEYQQEKKQNMNEQTKLNNLGENIPVQNTFLFHKPKEENHEHLIKENKNNNLTLI